MTIEKAPEATTKCSNCDGDVKVRRPSLTGYHFCQKPDCRRAKARVYARRVASGAAEADRKKGELRDDSIVSLVATIVTAPRIVCEGCGRTDALPGWPHPDPSWSKPCHLTGDAKMPSGIGDRLAQVLFPR